MLDKVVKYLPFISIGLFILSFAYLNEFYDEFRVHILDYITTSEIFTNLLPLTLLFFSIGLGFFQYVKRPKPTISFPHTENSNRPAKKYLIRQDLWLMVVAICLILIELVINHFYYPYRLAPLVHLISYALLVLALGDYFLIPLLRGINGNTWTMLVTFGLVGFLVMQYGSGKGRIVKLMGNDRQVQFKYKNSTFKSDSFLIYVGQTHSGVFLYNRLDSTTLIFNREEVDSFVVSNKK